jgi:DNA-binding transcriptional MocR family regulator
VRENEGCDRGEARGGCGEALEHNISVAPGPIFSARKEFRQAIRLNYGHPWTPKIDAAIRTLGNLIRKRCDQLNVPNGSLP